MTNNDDDLIINALRKKYSVALKDYHEISALLNEKKEDLNKCVLALRAWGDETINPIDSETSNNGNNEKNNKSDDNRYIYDSGATAKDKVIQIIKINDRAMSKHQLAQFICDQEPKLTINEAKKYINAPVFQLAQDGLLAQSKLKGVKMKGYFYGKPEWLVSEGVWTGIHEPKIEDKTKQTNIWE